MLFGLPLALCSSGVHPNAVKQSFSPSLLSTCPNQFHLYCRTLQLISLIPAISTTLLFVILCCHVIFIICLRHWHWKLLYVVFVCQPLWSSTFHSHIAGPVRLKSWIGVTWFSFLFLSQPTLSLISGMPSAGHLTGCGGADQHNSPTSAFSASLGHFSARNQKNATYKRESKCLPSSEAKIGKRLIILKKLFTQNSDQNTPFVRKTILNLQAFHASSGNGPGF